MVIPASAYPVSTFVRKYVLGDSGVSRSSRFQPVARSAAMRAPEPSTAFIAPNATSPTIRYSGAEIPDPPRFCSCRFGAAMRK